MLFQHSVNSDPHSTHTSASGSTSVTDGSNVSTGVGVIVGVGISVGVGAGRVLLGGVGITNGGLQEELESVTKAARHTIVRKVTSIAVEVMSRYLVMSLRNWPQMPLNGYISISRFCTGV